MRPVLRNIRQNRRDQPLGRERLLNLAEAVEDVAQLVEACARRRIGGQTPRELLRLRGRGLAVEDQVHQFVSAGEVHVSREGPPRPTDQPKGGSERSERGGYSSSRADIPSGGRAAGDVLRTDAISPSFRRRRESLRSPDNCIRKSGGAR